LVGVGKDGEPVTEAFNINTTGGTRTLTTAAAYATLTSATITAGSGFAGTVGIGVASALALPGSRSPAASAYVVHKAAVNNANETVGTVDAVAGTIVPTTVPNGTNNYAFYYQFKA
jgi:hypothetical protein